MPTALACVAALTLALAGCGASGPAPRPHAQWVLGTLEPAFDAEGPPDPVRAAVERLLTRGLVEEDVEGRAVPGIPGERIEWSADSLLVTFRLPVGLRFTDGSPCTAEAFRTALLAGLARLDHSTRRWQLAAVKGVDAIRLGKPLPATIGIEAPDATTLQLRLATADPLLLRKLAGPGTTTAWKSLAAPDWGQAIGLGPYRVVTADSTRRLQLVRAPLASGRAAADGRASAGLDANGSITSVAAVPDTLSLRFVPGAPRVRMLLRGGRVDLVWPLPPGMGGESVPAGYRPMTRDARPARWMVLVMRADVPPTTRPAARHALGSGINRADVMGALGSQAAEIGAWLPGAPAFDFPRLDPEAIERWREAAKLGRAFHVVMAYDPNGPAADIARSLQGEWSTHAIYVEMRPVTGRAREHEFLAGSASQLVVADEQDLIEDASGRLALVVMPFRGPAVGAVRTGWRTREFDPWILPGGHRLPWDPGGAQERVEQESIVLPLSRLRWSWIERTSGPEPTFHPRFGPLPPIAMLTSQTR